MPIRDFPATTRTSEIEAGIIKNMEAAAKTQHEVAAAYPDLYAVLGVSSTATADQMQKAYRRRALHLHPDKNSSPDATLAFQHVCFALEVLTDVDKREAYDKAGGGAAGVKAVREEASGPRFSFTEILGAALFLWLRPDIDPHDIAHRNVARDAANSAGMPPPGRSPEMWAKRPAKRAFIALALFTFTIFTLNTVDRYNLVDSGIVSTRQQRGFDEPVIVGNVNVPLTLAQSHTAVMQGLWGRNGKADAAKAMASTTPLHERLVGELKHLCQREIHIAQAAVMRNALSVSDALAALPASCAPLVRSG
jgi:hypothetical protein